MFLRTSVLCINAQFVGEQSSPFACCRCHPEPIALCRIDVEHGRLGRDLSNSRISTKTSMRPNPHIPPSWLSISAAQRHQFHFVVCDVAIAMPPVRRIPEDGELDWLKDSKDYENQGTKTGFINTPVISVNAMQNCTYTFRWIHGIMSGQILSL